MRIYRFVIIIELIILAIFVMTWNASGTTLLPTRMQVSIMNEVEESVEGVVVKVYATKDDYLNGTNVLVDGITNARGIVKFKELEPIEYYIEARKEKLSNDAEKVIVPILEEGHLNKVTIHIY